MPERKSQDRQESCARKRGMSPTRAVLTVLSAIIFVCVAAAAVTTLQDALRISERNRAFADAASAYEERVSDLIDERRQAAEALARAEAQLKLAAESIDARQRTLAEATAMTGAEQSEAAVSTGTEASLAMTRAEQGLKELAEAREAIAAAKAHAERVERTLTTVADELNLLSTERDSTHWRLAKLGARLRFLAGGLAQDEHRSERALAALQGSAESGLLKLRDMLEKTGLDPDAIIDQAAERMDAVGGPFRPLPDNLRALLEADAEAGERFGELVTDLESVHLLTYAAEWLPLSEPISTDFRFSSSYGPRRDPGNGRQAMHYGVDMAGPRGTPVMATADGEVVGAGWRTGFGKVVQIRHEFGMETVYAHLNQIRVDVGQRVRRGERIGDMGSTGRSTGSHLHYEIRHNGAPLNPMKFIEAGRDVY